LREGRSAALAELARVDSMAEAIRSFFILFLQIGIHKVID
jgi:hypothetical protein